LSRRLSSRILSVTLTVNEKSYTTSYAYDGPNRVTQIIYPDGSVVSYSYNVQGQVETVRFGDDSVTYSYDVDGAVVMEAFATGSVTNTYQYGNSLGQLTEISSALTSSDQSLFTETISYNDSNGVYQNGGIQRADFIYGDLAPAHYYLYTYDAFSRLTAATAYTASNSPLSEFWDIASITYDMNGNKISLSRSGASQTLHQTTGTDQVIGVNERRAYSYTAGGLMRQRPGGGVLNYDLLVPRKERRRLKRSPAGPGELAAWNMKGGQ
jgi:YD repeat-containing protein